VTDKNSDPCPQGDDCAVHFRNDEVIIDEEEQFGRLITYVGKYVVITSDNPELTSPDVLLRVLLKGQRDTLPPLYETCVVYVAEGALADVRKLSKKAQVSSIRFVQAHDDWDNFESAHQAIVGGVSEGWIDLSVPVYAKEKM